jgi:hypothetical protein
MTNGEILCFGIGMISSLAPVVGIFEACILVIDWRASRLPVNAAE